MTNGRLRLASFLGLALLLGTLWFRPRPAVEAAPPSPVPSAAPASISPPPPEILADWRLQDRLDAGQSLPQAVAAILKELGPAAGGLPARAAALTSPPSGPSALPTDPRWNALYLDACQLRRRHRLAAALPQLRQVVFTRHADLGGSHYAYTEAQSDAQAERHFFPGSSLCLFRLDDAGLYAKVENLLDDPRGMIRDPDVSFDGRRILFSWKRALNTDDFHLYELDTVTRQVRQITTGLGFADYEGIYLPDGNLLFNSTRCVQTVDCWWTEVSNLYTCDPDGRYLRRLSYDQVHTNFPTVTPDGRILYTRWDYSDRGQVYPQGLFEMHPDGTSQTAFYGNNSWFPTTILHARAIPGTQKVVAIFTGHHTTQNGKLGILDPARGREENAGAQLIAPVRDTPAVHVDQYGQDGEQFQYPYPLGPAEFLVSYKSDAEQGNFGLYWVDISGRRELLVADPAISCNQPIPLAPRPIPHIRPNVVDYRQDHGVFYIQDIYAGPGLAGLPRGTVKNLRVVAIEFRAAGYGKNGNHGPAGGALASTPVSIQGSWDVKTVLGTARVYDDGSACFKVPAHTPVYFQALDANNHAVQSMRSWAQLQPGEKIGCVGCHENKNTTPPLPSTSKPTAALRAGPQALAPFYGPSRGFSFEREIQPILDRKCISCHYLDDPSRMVDPSGGDAPPYPAIKPTPSSNPAIRPAFSLKGNPGGWSPAYRALANRRVNNWINIQSAPPMLAPYEAGAARSPLMALLRSGHGGARLTPEELDKISCWIDLLVPAFGDYTEGLPPEGKAFYNRFLEKRRRQAASERQNIEALLRDQPPH